jgi:hypothetical protein
MVIQKTPSGPRIKTCVLDGVLEIGMLETDRIFSSFKRWAFASRGGQSRHALRAEARRSPLQNLFSSLMFFWSLA